MPVLTVWQFGMLIIVAMILLPISWLLSKTKLMDQYNQPNPLYELIILSPYRGFRRNYIDPPDYGINIYRLPILLVSAYFFLNFVLSLC